MKKQNNSPLAEASTKFKVPTNPFQTELPLLEVMLETKAEIEALSAQIGLKIIHQFLQQEIQERCGRHGQQAGYVVYAGRKVSIEKPRLRAKAGKELTLKSYQAFQQDGRMQRAVA